MKKGAFVGVLIGWRGGIRLQLERRTNMWFRKHDNGGLHSRFHKNVPTGGSNSWDKESGLTRGWETCVAFDGAASSSSDSLSTVRSILRDGGL